MKKIITAFALFLSFTASAQVAAVSTIDAVASDSVVPRYGFLSLDHALKSMPEYAATQDSLQRLNEAYQKEVERVEDEFNKKYELFLEGQRSFPRTILLKRQNELQEMMQRNISFKADIRRDLQQAEQELMLPLRTRLNETLAVVAREYHLELILNTDGNACPFIEPTLSMDVQKLVEEYLK